MRGSPRVTALANKIAEVVRDASEKARWSWPSSREETRVPSSASVRRNAVAEVDKQRLVSNKLARSAPKRVAVRVNGGLGGAVSGHESVSGRVLEEVAGVSDYAGVNGAGPG